MVKFDAVRMWGVPDVRITEGTLLSGSVECVWCEKVANVGEFVLVVQEEGHPDSFVMHLKCMPPEMRAARGMVLDIGHLAQVQQNHAPQRV